MKILLGGGTGFIGKYLSKALVDRGHSVVIISRTPKLKALTWKQLETQRSLPDCDAVVNLSGENILNFMRRWNDEYKQDLYESRIGKNQLLVNLMSQGEFKNYFTNYLCCHRCLFFFFFKKIYTAIMLILMNLKSLYFLDLVFAVVLTYFFHNFCT